MSANFKASQTEKWYTRPVFSVSEIKRSLGFYCGQLGFSQGWDYQENDETIVTQVNKGEFELILTTNLDRVGMSRVFVSLEAKELEALENRIKQQNIPFERGFWGYPVIILNDPDGNELLVPLEEQNKSE